LSYYNAIAGKMEAPDKQIPFFAGRPDMERKYPDMDNYLNTISLSEDIDGLNADIISAYSIDESKYANVDVKRGLRNSDGTGVIIGVTGVGSVQGYTVIDGERVPNAGQALLPRHQLHRHRGGPSAGGHLRL
jgi:hypothetical protein